MGQINTFGGECCNQTGKYELCGCADGVPYIQLTVVGGGTVQTAWLNTETGDTFTTKPAGFVTGTCQEAAENDVLKFSATAPTATVPFAAPKDGYTTIQTSDGTQGGDVIGLHFYDAATSTWKPIPIVPLGGNPGDVLSIQPDGTRTWEAPTPQTVTTLTDTVTGHKIGAHTNESGAIVDINETITTVDNMEFDVVTGKVSFDFVNEAGTTVSLETTIPVGDKYKTTSATCNDVLANGNLTFTVATGLAYTPLQNIIAYESGGNYMNGHVVSYDSATGVLVMAVDQKTGAGNYCAWTINLDSIQPVTFVETITSITGTVTGHTIGTFNDENNSQTAIKETITGFTNPATAGAVIGTFNKEDGTTQTLYAPIFKELNRFYADPNGSDANTGANESPKLTVQAAVAALGQGDIAIINEGVYAGAVTMSLQNTSMSGADGAVNSLAQIASLAVTTASGTSNRVTGMTVVGAVTHTGGAPLYLERVTVGGNYVSTSAAYEEINDCKIQDGTITKTTTGTLFIKDSLIGNAVFNTPGQVISMDNVAIDPGKTLTIGAGVVYMFNDVRGHVIYDPAAIPAGNAALTAGLTGLAAKSVETATFNDIRLTNPPTSTTATKVLVRDADGVVSEQAIESFRPKVKDVFSNYPLTAADEGYMIYVDSATPITITAPANLPAGFIAEIYQEGAGQVTVVGGVGNTLRSANGFKTRVQHSAIGVSYKTANLSNVVGDSAV